MIKFNGQFYFLLHIQVVTLFALMAYSFLIIAVNISLKPEITTLYISLLDTMGFFVLLFLYGYMRNHNIQDSDYGWIKVMRKHEWYCKAIGYKESDYPPPYAYHRIGEDLPELKVFRKKHQGEWFADNGGNFDHVLKLKMLDEYLTDNKDEILFKLI